MIEYSSISNPVWANEDKTMITVDVVFKHLGPDAVKFNASPEDVHEHGREIYAAIIAGKYGEISDHNQ